MSSPNSVGIDPASAYEDVFKASGRLVYQLGRFSTNCNKVIFAQRPLVYQSGRFSTNCNKVIFARKSNHGQASELSKRVQNRRKWKRTGQLVAVETKVSQVDELAEFGGD